MKVTIDMKTLEVLTVEFDTAFNEDRFAMRQALKVEDDKSLFLEINRKLNKTEIKL